MIEENPFVDIYNFCCPSVCPTPSTVTTAAGGVDYLVTQVAHGFVAGLIIRCIGLETFALAKSDTVANCEAVGAVSLVVDADHFFIRFIGNLDVFTGLTPGVTYFLSDTIAGALTPDEPTAVGSISKPLLIAHTTTAGFLFNFRGIEPGTLPDAATSSITVETSATGDFAAGGPILTNIGSLNLNSAYFKIQLGGAGQAEVTLDPSVFNPVAQDRTVTFFADGAGSALTLGIKNSIKVPFGGTLQGWTMMCSPTGSVTLDILRAANSGGLPVTSIVGGGGTMPSISSGVENSSTDFTGWTSTAITAKDNIAISVSGVVNVTYCEITLHYK